MRLLLGGRSIYLCHPLVELADRQSPGGEVPPEFTDDLLALESDIRMLSAYCIGPSSALTFHCGMSLLL